MIVDIYQDMYSFLIRPFLLRFRCIFFLSFDIVASKICIRLERRKFHCSWKWAELYLQTRIIQRIWSAKHRSADHKISMNRKIDKKEEEEERNGKRIENKKTNIVGLKLCVWVFFFLYAKYTNILNYMRNVMNSTAIMERYTWEQKNFAAQNMLLAGEHKKLRTLILYHFCFGLLQCLNVCSSGMRVVRVIREHSY